MRGGERAVVTHVIGVLVTVVPKPSHRLDNAKTNADPVGCRPAQHAGATPSSAGGYASGPAYGLDLICDIFRNQSDS